MVKQIFSILVLIVSMIGMVFNITHENPQAIMGFCIAVIACIAWSTLLYNQRMLERLRAEADKRSKSDRITIEQQETQIRRKTAEVTEANAQITRQMSTINNLEVRLRAATVIARNPGHVSTREAILEPTPPARMSSLPGFNQNRVPKEERRTELNPHLGTGGRYSETIRDDVDNGLGSFALGALVGNLLSDDKSRCEPETPTIEPGGGSFGGAGASASWSEPARSEPTRSEPAYESPSYNSNDTDTSSPSGD